MKLAAVTVTGGGAITALAATGWGLAAVLGMLFVLCLLVLCSRKANGLFCRGVAALKALPGTPPVLEAHNDTAVRDMLEPAEPVRLRQVQDVPDARPPA